MLLNLTCILFYDIIYCTPKNTFFNSILIIRMKRIFIIIKEIKVKIFIIIPKIIIKQKSLKLYIKIYILGLS
jgi:hypothetical protein